MTVTLAKFIADVWRTKPLDDGTSWEVRRQGPRPYTYRIYELGNEDADGELVYDYMGTLAQCRLEIAHLVGCHDEDRRHADDLDLMPRPLPVDYARGRP